MASYQNTFIVPGGIAYLILDTCLNALKQVEAQVIHTDAVHNRIVARTKATPYIPSETLTISIFPQENQQGESRHRITVVSESQDTVANHNQQNTAQFEQAFWALYPGTTTSPYGSSSEAPKQSKFLDPDAFKRATPSEQQASPDDEWLTFDNDDYYDPYAKKDQQASDQWHSGPANSPLMDVFLESINKSRDAQNPAPAEPRVFMSYRRADSADVSGRMYDRLSAAFGQEAIFKDVNNIPIGVNFPDYLLQQVQQCDVLLAIMGPIWANITYTSGAKEGQRRLHDPADFVRIEIESALKIGLPVVPVYVGHASPPALTDLPEVLQPLVWLNGIQVRPDPDFHHDMDRLIEGLRSMKQSSS
ncbi:toll/interleukin-1 receptor domain-containing protein [Phototrophicus methaneseepsis]|uniref:Toll/interleukin-1 receptor domain-containing protein n=1 Tax=Phototrophicus methaneseepsis TaxID=2710758 RepID=A0A7S8IFQ3_9CHLR|nr:toll/interleukin-1 receptor domain-containing protein [Phototrophicus methaneseepsis]QPC83188.1 toll/interleukin-1 receptor domain-containing protein [Phototrophicus methaneseepsis]